MCSFLELIAGTLILYPTYLNIDTGKISNATSTTIKITIGIFLHL